MTEEYSFKGKGAIIDVTNSMGGGCVAASVYAKFTIEAYELEIHVPSIKPEMFELKIKEARYDKPGTVTVCVHMKSYDKVNDMTAISHLFNRVFVIPENVEARNIFSESEGDLVRIIMPRTI